MPLDLKLGSKLDNRPSNQPYGSWRKAKNLVFKEGNTSLTNEEGFELFITSVNGVPATQLLYSHIGIIQAADRIVIFTTDNTTSEIGVLELTGAYRTISRSTLWGFNLANPIEGRYKYNYKKELTISWWDGVSSTSKKPKILNLDTLPFLINNITFDFINPDEYVLTYLFPEFTQPDFSLTSVNQGGGLISSGVYYFVISYMIGEFDQTDYTALSNPIPVGVHLNPTSPELGLNHPANQLVNLSLSLNITGLDTRYKRVKLGLIRRAGNIYSAHDVVTMPISLTGSINFTYNGTHESDFQDINEIVGLRTVFEKVKTGTESSNKLILGNIVQKERIKYQCFANNIKTTWGRFPNNEGYNAAKGEVIFNTKGLCPDEVYALYIGFNFKDGTRSEAFHIPGRAPENIDNEAPVGSITFVINDVLNINGFAAILISGLNTWDFQANGTQVNISGTIYDVTEIRDTTETQPSGFITYAQIFILNLPAGSAGAWTGSNITAFFTATANTLSETAPLNLLYSATQYEVELHNDLKIFHINNGATYTPSTTLNKLSYWENENELYPDTDDFDVCTLVGGQETVIGTLRNRKVRHHRMPDNQFQLDSTGQEYGHYTIGLRFTDIVIPLDIVDKVDSFYFLYAERNIKNSTVLGGSFCIPDASQTILGGTTAGVDIEETKYTFRTYPFHLLVDRPAIGIAYLKSQFYRPVNIEHYISPGKASPVADLSSVTSDFISQQKRITPIIGYEYVNENNSAHDLIDNTGREVALILKPKNPFEDKTGLGQSMREYLFGIFDFSDNVYRFDRLGETTNNSTRSHIRYDDIQYCLLKSILFNIYTNFYDQTLISTNRKFPVVAGQTTYDTGGTEANLVFNFDTFNGNRIQYHKRNITDASFVAPGDNNIALLKINQGEYSYANIFYREKERGNIGVDKNIGHEYKYDLSYNSANNLKTTIPYHPYVDYVNQLPYRIVLSNPQQDEGKSQHWRIFYMDSYYEMPRNKGVIWALRGLNTDLYIQMRNSLFYTNTKDVLKTNEINAYLESSDLFDRQPNEILSDDEGYVGSGDMFSSILGSFGYVTYDRDRKQLVIVNRDSKPLIVSDNGYREEFLNKGTLSNLDNPFIKQGFYIVYDDKYRRLIFVKNVLSREFTTSYSLSQNCFISEHDYAPNFMVSLRTGVFAFTGNQTYKTNAGNKAQYINGTIYPSYVEFVANNPRDIEKLFKSFNWETEIKDSNGVYIHDKTFTSVIIFNNNKCSGRINLTQPTTFYDFVSRNIRGVWSLNKFRDLVINPLQPIFDNNNNLILSNIATNKPFFDKSKFFGTFAIIRLEYDNQEQNTLYINNVDYVFQPYRNNQLRK